MRALNNRNPAPPASGHRADFEASSAQENSGNPVDFQAKGVKFRNQAKWRQNHPKQVWAQAALRSALNRGLIIQQPCEECGDANAEAHHDDYDKPMCVRWLCRLHHKAEHRRLRQGGDA
ncbi:hypothetical protein [Mesorhizobium sp. LjNodule214]|uniref:hypothetical protein n=1 Tax=Mesorhizobium sp. LjNodule214 TaxID=3342252 RepID=UPI003ECF6BF2